jgi:hypothetical protein
VIYVDHLIESCGTDAQKLAGLALLLAMAAYAMGAMAGANDDSSLKAVHLEQLAEFERAADEIARRVAEFERAADEIARRVARGALETRLKE